MVISSVLTALAVALAVAAVVLGIVVFQLTYFPARQIRGLNAALQNKGEALVRLTGRDLAP